jgi:hypothetical protein
MIAADQRMNKERFEIDARAGAIGIVRHRHTAEILVIARYVGLCREPLVKVARD